jgi:hypothetical protein
MQVKPEPTGARDCNLGLVKRTTETGKLESPFLVVLDADVVSYQRNPKPTRNSQTQAINKKLIPESPEWLNHNHETLQGIESCPFKHASKPSTGYPV